MITHAPAATRSTTRPGTGRLLVAGAVAGPLYVAVSLAQALTREGFDLARHPWSALSNGDLGGVQITNFVLTGLLVVAFAVGLRRVLAPGRGAVWAPRLVGVYGASLVGAGVFRADPVPGFPAGTVVDPTAVSGAGLAHLAVGAVGFLCLTAACLVLARRFSGEGRRGAAISSAVVGVVFLGAFVGIASGAGSPATVALFVGAVVVMWGWMSALAISLLRATR